MAAIGHLLPAVVPSDRGLRMLLLTTFCVRILQDFHAGSSAEPGMQAIRHACSEQQQPTAWFLSFPWVGAAQQWRVHGIGLVVHMTIQSVVCPSYTTTLRPPSNS
jgi:hypothetical protein